MTYPRTVNEMLLRSIGKYRGLCSHSDCTNLQQRKERFATSTIIEADLIAHCQRQLSAYKVPKEVRFLDALPKSNVGKILAQ